MMTEDLSLFFDEADFAVSATFTPSGGSAAPSAPVIFDRDGAVLDAYDVQTSGPSVLIPATQWSGIGDGDGIVVALPSGDESFIVRGITPLRDGALVLVTLAAL